MEMTPHSIAEVLVQCGFYGGFPVSETALRLLHEIFAERRIIIEDDASGDTPLEELESLGQALMEELHGAQSAVGYADPDNAFTGDLYRLAVQFGYGVIWRRPGLDIRQRMLCSLVSFSVLGLEGTFRKFAASAANVGLEPPEIVEPLCRPSPMRAFQEPYKC
jgi:4-carboxymuconolactone decarboxylase